MTRMKLPILFSRLQNDTHVYKTFFLILFVIIFSSCLLLVIINIFSGSKDYEYFDAVDLNIYNAPTVKLKSDVKPSPRNNKCTHWDCFDIYKCGRNGHDKITVYLYPLTNFMNDEKSSTINYFSKEYYQILKAVIKSEYYTPNPNEACIFIPSIDTLNLERISVNETLIALNTLPYWHNGKNHLIFNMLSSFGPTAAELDLGNALIAGADFDTYNFRVNFDISIPLFSPYADVGETKYLTKNRSFFITSSQLSLDPYYLDELQKLSLKNPNLFLLLDSCSLHNYTSRCEINSGKHYAYPQILRNSTFCVIFRGTRMSQFILLEALAARCIPVIIINEVVMPFNSVIDWKKAAIFVMEDYLHTLVNVLKKISNKKIVQMQKTIGFLYSSYFSSMERITLTTLDVLQDRVFAHLSKMYDEWNLLPEERSQNALFLPHTVPKSLGFTAVVLTYDRVNSLFTLISRISVVPSLMKVIVVWNNQKKNPPPLSAFPVINKPIKIIRTAANKLSNRFLPYKEIETEAILHLDDDITMLTADELEFGYEVWREFPDRIVGFPSRTHTWDNETQSWRYESEWTNELSMVLTGAAFLHKYYSYLYTKKLNPEIKNWVDENMNCEDIAMNFLVANVTNQPPIKVTPRKKFKCPECSNEMLSADIGHMVERSKCVDKFAKIFGRIPLQYVEFRADPVLYKDPFPEKLKRFNDIGNL